MTFKQAVFAAKKSTVLRRSQNMYKQLLRDQHLDQHESEKLQAERAIAHARFAMQSTEFYREVYSGAGFTLKDLDDPAAFRELPIVEKADVRENPGKFRSSEATDRNSKVSVTGGSTGEPLRLLRDLRTPTRTLEWRLFDWWGVDPSDDVAILVRRVRSDRAELAHSLQWWPSKRFQLDAYRMTDEKVDEFLARWDRIGPSLLIGYVGGISELAQMLATRGIRIRPPRAIAVTAAPMTPAQRQLIESAFGAPAFDHYRSAEIPWMAGECSEHNGLHTFADVRKVEVLDGSGRQVAPGVIGDVVVSDLTNRVFPLVRYRLGDRTTPIAGPCACGITLPRIEHVTGRISEAMRMPDGQIVAGEALSQTFSRNPAAVRQFQIHQQADYSIVIRCIPGGDPDARRDIDSAIDQVRDIVRNKVPVRLEIVESIAHDGGKIRYIKSDLN
ncbi:phenylacetate-CoA ligase [Glaciihabitans sp. UYNi722]